MMKKMNTTKKLVVILGPTACGKTELSIDIAKNELELKHKDRNNQIELLTKSLTSSSRFGRWISSIRSLINQLVENKK